MSNVFVQLEEAAAVSTMKEGHWYKVVETMTQKVTHYIWAGTMNYYVFTTTEPGVVGRPLDTLPSFFANLNLRDVTISTQKKVYPVQNMTVTFSEK